VTSLAEFLSCFSLRPLRLCAGRFSECYFPPRPDSLITFAHLAISTAYEVPNSSGGVRGRIGLGRDPFSYTSASLSILGVGRNLRDDIARGSGRTRAPEQALVYSPRPPASAMVGSQAPKVSACRCHGERNESSPPFHLWARYGGMLSRFTNWIAPPLRSCMVRRGCRCRHEYHVVPVKT